MDDQFPLTRGHTASDNPRGIFDFAITVFYGKQHEGIRNRRGRFCGQPIEPGLLDRGDEVVGHDNMDPYYALEHKKRHLRDLQSDARFKFIKGDLVDAPALKELFARERPDAVAHLAAQAAVRYSVEHPLMYGQVNVQGSMNVLDAARHLGTPRCVLASTGSTYGKDTPVPLRRPRRRITPSPPTPRANARWRFSLTPTTICGNSRSPYCASSTCTAHTAGPI